MSEHVGGGVALEKNRKETDRRELKEVRAQELHTSPMGMCVGNVEQKAIYGGGRDERGGKEIDKAKNSQTEQRNYRD